MEGVLARYVPNVVLARYMKDPNPLSGPELYSFAAAVGFFKCFFDISGFSTLASTLRDKEARASSYHKTVKTHTIARMPSTEGGATEALTSKLNMTLEPVINVIKMHHGDIIKFAGDAMIVVWETEASMDQSFPWGILTYYAATCSLAAVDALTHNDSCLGLHVGIGVGKVTGNHVGGILNRCEYYISGNAVEQMNQAELEAKTGHTVLSHESYGQLTQCSELQDLKMKSLQVENGCYLLQSLEAKAMTLPTFIAPKMTDEIVSCIASYVPGTVKSALKAGQPIKNDGCMRMLSVLFIDVLDVLDIEDPQEQLELANRSFRAIQEATYHVRGTIRQFLIDDKGAVAIAAVGLPPFFHEDNAVRAAKIGNRLLKNGYRVSIGITTGLAFCGSVGSLVRSEYAIVADFINLAARFMAQANPCEILCDETTSRCIREYFTVKRGISVMVKGQKKPVLMFKVGPASNKDHFVNIEHHELVGVDDTLERFKSIEQSAL